MFMLDTPNPASFMIFKFFVLIFVLITSKPKFPLINFFEINVPTIVPVVYPPEYDKTIQTFIFSIFIASLATKNQIVISRKANNATIEVFPFRTYTVLTVEIETSKMRAKKILILRE